MTDAHTPERWEADEFRVFMGDGGISLHNVPNGIERARLIAAAPDLLEALRGCLPYIRDMDDQGPAGEGWQSERLSRLIAEADTAILKATATEQGERG